MTVALVGALGNLMGSWLAYWVGRVGGRPLIDRWGRYLLLRPQEVDRAHDWFERRGEPVVFFSRLLPVIRTFISLPAGVARMGMGRFTAYTLLGCLPWTFGLTFIGYKMGERWKEVEGLIRPFAWAIALVGVLAIAWWVRRRLVQLRTERASRTEPEAATPARATRGD